MSEDFDPNVREFLQQARDAIAASDWQRAKERSLAVLAFEPDDTVAAGILAAVDKLPRVPDDQRSQSLLAQARDLVALGEWDRAEERALAVQAFDPYNADAAWIIAASKRRTDMFSLEDPQTGKRFPLRYEDLFANIVAGAAFTYLLASLLFFIWMAVDTLLGQFTLLEHVFGYDHETLTAASGYRLLSLVAIAGAFGGTLDAIRSIVRWHSEANAYGPRFFFRDLAMPWIGGAIGVLTYVVVRGGAGLLNGDFRITEGGGVSLLAAAALGFLGGFSSVQVYKWLDATGDRIFSTVQEPKAPAPAAAQSGATQPAEGAG